MKGLNHFKDNEIEIRITSYSLIIKTAKKIEDVELSHDSIQDGKSYWKVRVSEKTVWLMFDHLTPDLLNASVTIHKSKKYNTLRIKLSSNPISTWFNFYMRKPKYVRPQWIRDYHKSKSK